MGPWWALTMKAGGGGARQQDGECEVKSPTEGWRTRPGRTGGMEPPAVLLWPRCETLEKVRKQPPWKRHLRQFQACLCEPTQS